MIILAIVCVLAVAGLLIYINVVNRDNRYIDGTNVAIYNYYEFNRHADDIWYLQMMIKNRPYEIPFYYNPFETEDIPFDNRTMPTIAAFQNRTGPKVVYVSIDPLASSKIAVAAFELKRIIGTNYDIFNFQTGYGIHYKHIENYTEYPVATCSDARPNRLIIMINVTGENSVHTQDNCIIMNSADVNESVRVSDALAFRLLGIIQPSTINRAK